MTERPKPFDELFSPRLIGRYGPPRQGHRRASTKQRFDENMYGGWFAQDLGRSLPYGRGLDEGFELNSAPADPAALAILVEALPTRNYPHSFLSDAFRELVEASTYDLIEGPLRLELEFYYESLEHVDPPVAFKIHILRSDEIVQRPWSTRRLVYVADIDPPESGRWVQQAVIRANLVEARLARRFRKALRRATELYRLASEQSLMGSRLLIDGPRGASAFDFKTHRDLLNDHLLRATRDVGWGGRGSFLDGFLDPEKAWRSIQFARLQVAIRDTVLGALQEAVDRAGERMGFKIELSLTGVLTAADLDVCEVELANGSRNIAELFHPKPAAGVEGAS